MRRLLMLCAMVLLAADASAQVLAGSQVQMNGPNLTGTGANDFQATAATGSELAPAIAAANWTCGAGWDCSVAGTLNKNAAGAGTAAPTAAITAVVGTTYRSVITVATLTAGILTSTLGGVSQCWTTSAVGGTCTTTISAAGTYYAFSTAATTASEIITPVDATRGTITAVSVKALTDATGDLNVQGNLSVQSPSYFAAPIFATNGSNFSVYNLCAGAGCATGHELGFVAWESNEFRLKTSFAGTGVTRNIGLSSLYVFLRGVLSLETETTDFTDLGNAVRNFKSAYLSRSIQGSKSKTLTDAAAAVSFVRIAVPQTVGANYAGGTVVWTAFAADATPHTQSLSGRETFTAVNNAGSEVCTVDPTAAVTAPNANSSGTLACTLSCANVAADTVDLQVTCDTSFGTPTAMTFFYRLDMPVPNTVTPQ